MYWTLTIASTSTSTIAILLAVAAKSLQSCLTLCNPMDCSPPGSSVHGIVHHCLLCLGNYVLEFELKFVLFFFFFLLSRASFKEHPSSSELYFKEALKSVLINMLILPLLWNSNFMIQKLHVLGCSWLRGQQCIPWDV